jgi:hypothetical protein
MESLALEDIGILYGHMVYFAAIWYILWPFGTFCGHLVFFIVVWCIFYRFGNPGLNLDIGPGP